MDEKLKWYGLVRYSKKTGKVDTAITGLGKGLLQIWALQNTTSTKQTTIFELDTGIISSEYIGTKDGFPKCERNLEHKIEKVDEPIRAALAKQETRNR